MKKKPGVYTAKNGRKYRILPNGQARFLKAGATTKKKAKAKRKGGALRTGGSARSGGKLKRGGAAMAGGGMGFVHY